MDQIPKTATAQLVMIYPDDAIYPLDKIIVIGRGNQCDVILRNAEVSPLHARIKRQRFGTFRIQAIDESRLYVNDVETTSARLDGGERIQIGKFIFIFQRGENLVLAHKKLMDRYQTRDRLTEAYDEAFFKELLFVLTQYNLKSDDYELPLAVAMGEVDDMVGLMSDDFADGIIVRVLVEVAALIRECIDSDIHHLGIINGTIFALLMFESEDRALRVVASIAKAVSGHRFSFIELREPQVPELTQEEELQLQSLTMSFGVAQQEIWDSDCGSDPFEDAMRSLSRAQQEGRGMIFSGNREWIEEE